jgi:hypothetical protein
MDKMENVDNKLWDIECTPETFESLKSDERFLSLLALARFTNAIRFCQQPAISASKSDSPAASRQIINSFLFASAVLYEGFLLVERLGKHFHDLDSFKKGFGALLRDKKVKELRKSFLYQMRNRFVFHFDDVVAKDALKNFKLPNYKFASCLGNTSGEMYFNLADEAVMNYILQSESKEFDDDPENRLPKLTQDITELMVNFALSADRLMVEALPGMGWSAKIRDK